MLVIQTHDEKTFVSKAIEQQERTHEPIKVLRTTTYAVVGTAWNDRRPAVEIQYTVGTLLGAETATIMYKEIFVSGNSSGDEYNCDVSKALLHQFKVLGIEYVIVKRSGTF